MGKLYITIAFTSLLLLQSESVLADSIRLTNS